MHSITRKSGLQKTIIIVRSRCNVERFDWLMSIQLTKCNLKWK